MKGSAARFRHRGDFAPTLRRGGRCPSVSNLQRRQAIGSSYVSHVCNPLTNSEDDLHMTYGLDEPISVDLHAIMFELSLKNDV